MYGCFIYIYVYICVCFSASSPGNVLPLLIAKFPLTFFCDRI